MLFCVVCSKVCEGYAGGGAEIAHMQSKLMEHIGNEPPDEEYCNQLQKFFAFIHPQINGKKHNSIHTNTYIDSG
jgi:hypothetical protein